MSSTGPAVSSSPSKSQNLEDAIHAFYTAIGAPTRPRGPVPAPRPAPATLTPRAAELRRHLTNGVQLTGPEHLPVGYSVTAKDVRLRAFHHGPTLHRDEIVELHAALTAWLTLNPANSPNRDTARQAEKQPRKR